MQVALDPSPAFLMMLLVRFLYPTLLRWRSFFLNSAFTKPRTPGIT